jgi:hypothetical protein
MCIPSVSYADDVALIGGSEAEIQQLIGAYLHWCTLLDLEVTKVQLWWNGRGTRRLQVGSLAVETQPVFKMVGVVLAAKEAVATALHLEKRLPKAMATAQRLRSLDVPTSLAAHLWRSTVLPQALYGCELRHLTAAHLQPLTMLGRTLLAANEPLQFNVWRAPEVLCGPPLGASALLDPVWAMRSRQLCWLQLLANLPSLVGAVHREVAILGDIWAEPGTALQAALADVGWRVVRNEACLQAVGWPFLLPELGYPGEVRLGPVDDLREGCNVFTDGSVADCMGGAAAVMPDRDEVRQLRVPTPRSSTHCELVALGLAL